MAADDLRKFAENKYNCLLSILVLLLISIALPGEQNPTKAIGFSLCLIMLLLIVRRIKPGRQLLTFYTCLVGSNLLLLGLRLFGLFPARSLRYGEFAIQVILLLVISLPILLIQREIFATTEVTADTLKGGIAIYLLLGFAWATFYNTLYDLNSQAFRGILTPYYQADFLHFSFTTLTTVGYGDITPATTLARISADLEAIAGVMYPTILIARLVSLYNHPSQESS